MGVGRGIKFTDNSQACKNALDKACLQYLHSAKDMIANSAAKNSPVDSGKLKKSFLEDSEVDRDEKIAYVGSSLEYSIYQEKGTGEFATKGGRTGGWAYKDPSGKWHFTKGSKPHNMLKKAFATNKSKVEKLADDTYRKYIK